MISVQMPCSNCKQTVTFTTPSFRTEGGEHVGYMRMTDTHSGVVFHECGKVPADA